MIKNLWTLGKALHKIGMDQKSFMVFDMAANYVIDPDTDMGKEPWVIDIENLTEENENFRTTKWTGDYFQMTVMSLKEGEEVGLEVHPDIDQFIRLEQGKVKVLMGPDKDDMDEWEAEDDFAIFIPAGTWHNIINSGEEEVKLYSIYAKPEHPAGTVHETYEDAMEDEHDHDHEMENKSDDSLTVKAYSERVFRSHKPFEGFKPVTEQNPGFKPRGLWYSCGSSWDDFCRYEMPERIDGSPYLYEIEVDLSKMIVIQNSKDFNDFVKKYSLKGFIMEAIDWARVAEDYDGIEICPYLPQFRQVDWYYGWDVASGCIWGEGAFKSVKLIDCKVENEDQEVKSSVRKYLDKSEKENSYESKDGEKGSYNIISISEPTLMDGKRGWVVITEFIRNEPNSFPEPIEWEMWEVDKGDYGYSAGVEIPGSKYRLYGES